MRKTSDFKSWLSVLKNCWKSWNLYRYKI